MLEQNLCDVSSAKKRNSIIVLIVGSLLLCVVFVCGYLRLHTDSVRNADFFNSCLRAADNCIAQGDIRTACRNLQKAQKSAITSTNWLSIIKRYYALNDFESAASVAISATSLFPANSILSFICAYSCVLAGKLSDALTYVRPLTTGGGAVLNAALQMTLLSFDAWDPVVIKSAALASNIYNLRQNAAVLYAVRGDFAVANQLSPDFQQLIQVLNNVIAKKNAAKIQESVALLAKHNPLFWMTLLYDSGVLNTALQQLSALNAAKKAAGTNPDPELLSLQADTAFITGKKNEAFTIWRQLTDLYPSYSPEIWYNLAALSSSGVMRCPFIAGMLDNFPDYPPALRMAALEAIACENRRKLDSIENVLAEAGMKTIAMLRQDSEYAIDMTQARNYFVLSDEYRKKRDLPPDDRIVLERNRLEWAFLPPDKALIEIWRLLEQFPDSVDITEYAVWLFLTSGQVDNASRVLSNWLLVHDPLPWSDLLGAYCMAISGHLDDAEMTFRSVSSSYGCSWFVFANLALFSEIRGNLENASDFLNLALTRTDNPLVQSKLQYHYGQILVSCRNIIGAKTALHYAIELDPDNYQAKVLLMSLNHSQK